MPVSENDEPFGKLSKLLKPRINQPSAAKLTRGKPSSGALLTSPQARDGAKSQILTYSSSSTFGVFDC